MQSWFSTTGYCCDKTNTADVCSSTRYFCTDAAPNSIMQYNYCPFNQTLCYDKAQTTLIDNSQHTGATSNFFGNNHICAWKIKTTSDYYFNKKIVIDFAKVNQTTCYIAYGESMVKATNTQSCSVGDQITIDAN